VVAAGPPFLALGVAFSARGVGRPTPRSGELAADCVATDCEKLFVSCTQGTRHCSAGGIVFWGNYAAFRVER
jgi:hypothetical protein